MIDFRVPLFIRGEVIEDDFVRSKPPMPAQLWLMLGVPMDGIHRQKRSDLYLVGDVGGHRAPSSSAQGPSPARARASTALCDHGWLRALHASVADAAAVGIFIFYWVTLVN